MVDDRLENREVLGQLLRSEGALVCEAASALEAKVFLERQHFDLVLLDIMMPEVNGFEFMEQLKRSETIFQSSFIVLSALAENEIRLQALEKGALDVITKPFDLNEMRFRLLNSLARLRYVQNRERSSAELQLRQFTDMTSELSHEIKNLILCDKDEVQQMIGHLCLNLKQEDGNWNEIKQALTSMKTCRYDLAEKRYHELQSLFRPDDREVRRFIRLVSDIDTLANSRALIQEVQAMDQLDRQRINGLLRTSLYLFDQLERQTSLKDLVYHMLEFSRKSSNSEQTDILGLINSCLALQKRRFQAAAIEVTVKGESIAGTWPMHTIRQVFINLMNNAIDALQSLEGEHKLQVELGIQNSTLEIVVRDNGPGIRAGWEEKIWLRHASTKTHQAGYGLGLGFARELIRQQGGDLVLRRASHPTEFLLTVPLSESKDWRKVS